MDKETLLRLAQPAATCFLALQIVSLPIISKAGYGDLGSKSNPVFIRCVNLVGYDACGKQLRLSLICFVGTSLRENEYQFIVWENTILIRLFWLDCLSVEHNSTRFEVDYPYSCCFHWYTFELLCSSCNDRLNIVIGK